MIQPSPAMLTCDRGKEVIGLMPAGGQATRVAPLPCSKELYPVGFRPVDQGRSLRPKVVCHYLLERMRLAGVTRVYIVLRPGKWDIPAYLGDGTMLDMHLAYLMMRLSYGIPYTLDQAYPSVRNALVVVGFPDIIFHPVDAFVQLLSRQVSTGADIVLGLFPAERPQKVDMVDRDDRGLVRQIVIKPRQTRLRYAWFIAVWTSVFTHFMHEYLAATLDGSEHGGVADHVPEQQELYLGNVIQAAIDREIRVESVLFPNGTYVDIGTPDDLVKAVRNLG